jgi:hypothetical protein
MLNLESLPKKINGTRWPDNYLLFLMESSIDKGSTVENVGLTIYILPFKSRLNFIL